MLKISVTRRGHDYMAFLKDDGSRWGCGASIDEAIGNAIRGQAVLIETSQPSGEAGRYGYTQVHLLDVDALTSSETRAAHSLP